MFKKISIIIILMMAITILSSCRQTYTYEFLYDQDRITSIDIIYVEMNQDELDIDYLKSIADKESFMQDFKALEFQKYLYVDQPRIYQKIGVMITYDTDDFEIITYDAQEVFFSIDQTSRISRFYMDKTDFEAFLQIYDEEIQID